MGTLLKLHIFPLLLTLLLADIQTRAQQPIWSMLKLHEDEYNMTWENIDTWIYDTLFYYGDRLHTIHAVNDSVNHIEVFDDYTNLLYAFDALIKPYRVVRYIEDLETGDKKVVYNSGLQFVMHGAFKRQGNQALVGQFDRGIPIGQWKLQDTMHFYTTIAFNTSGVPSGDYAEYYGRIDHSEGPKTIGQYCTYPIESAVLTDFAYLNENTWKWSTRCGTWKFFHVDGTLAQTVEYGIIKTK